MRLLTQLNIFRRKALGLVGAPVATAAATATILGWGVPAVTQYINGAPVAISMKVAFGAAVAVVLVTEAGFYFAGQDAEVVLAANATQLGDLGRSLKNDAGLRKVAEAVSKKSEAEVLTLANFLISAEAAMNASKGETPEKVEQPEKKRASG